MQKKKKMGRPPVLTDAQKRAIRKEVMGIIGSLVINLTFLAAGASTKKVKKRKAKRKVKKKAKKKVVVKKRGRRKKRAAPSTARFCRKCKKVVNVHPRQQDCTKCGAKKSLKKIKRKK